MSRRPGRWGRFLSPLSAACVREQKLALGRAVDVLLTCFWEVSGGLGGQEAWGQVRPTGVAAHPP